jgi:putative PIN family toxin of toxin-antitoxin system
MTYVILDTNVLVSALWRSLLEGKPALLLDLCMEKRYSAVYTRAILDEYAAVLTRPKFGFEQSDVRSLLDFFEFNALNAEPLFDSLSRTQCADPDDQKFYDAATCWDALLVTGNKKHYPEDKRVMTPAEFFEHRHLPESKVLSFLS